MIHAILDVLLAFLDERENEKRVSQGSVFFWDKFHRILVYGTENTCVHASSDVQ